MNNCISHGGHLIGFIGVLLLAGCAVSTDQIDEDEGDDGFDSTAYSHPIGAPLAKAFTTLTGKTWIVRQTPLSDPSQVNISVEVRGFSTDSALVEFGENDPVIAIQQADLDKDGFEELYLFTRSTDPEAYGTVFGLYSNQDKSVSMISFEGATPYNTKEGESYAGYQGKDVFMIEDGVLRNAFPIHLADGTIQGQRTVVYELVSGETSMRLRPVEK